MRPEALLRALADGRRHSGPELAADLGVTRAAVWKQMRALSRWDLAVASTRGRGYQLCQPIDWLDEATIRADVGARCALAELTLCLETDSTNQRLLDAPAPPPGTLVACLAEFQTAGRGRRGRAWRAPLGSGLCLSVAWRFDTVPPDFAALALAVGVVVRAALEAQGCPGITLKWPNDLVHDGRKLGGILVEVLSEAHGQSHVVVGLGVNYAVPDAVLRDMCDWPAGATDLRRIAPSCPSRSRLAAEIIAGLGQMFPDFAQRGFAPYRDAWRRADCLRGRSVDIVSGQEASVGTALGIDDDGALLLQLPDGAQMRLNSGEVSLRARA